MAAKLIEKWQQMHYQLRLIRPAPCQGLSVPILATELDCGNFHMTLDNWLIQTKPATEMHNCSATLWLCIVTCSGSPQTMFTFV